MNKDAGGTGLHRRDEILRIVREEHVRSQEDLQNRLRSRGFVVTQPTLSRDLKDLAIAKSPSGYVVTTDGPSAESGTDRTLVHDKREEILDRALREFVRSVVCAGTIVVVKTPPAAAHPVARAIDNARLDGTAGTIAGDDTIFIAALSGIAASRVAERLLRPIHPAFSRKRSRSIHRDPSIRRSGTAGTASTVGRGPSAKGRRS